MPVWPASATTDLRRKTKPLHRLELDIAIGATEGFNMVSDPARLLIIDTADCDVWQVILLAHQNLDIWSFLFDQLKEPLTMFAIAEFDNHMPLSQ